MNTIFRNLTSHDKVDIVSAVRDFCATRNVSIYIGCDSQNSRKQTTYAVAIVLHNEDKGAQVFYSKTVVKKIVSKFERLWKEVEMSIEIANYLRDNGIQPPVFIDLDLNASPHFESNKLLSAAMGYVESMGYTPRCKPDAAAASHIADSICK